jgi:hypothetical protein
MSPEKVAKIVKECMRHGRLPDGSRKCLLCGDVHSHEPMFVGVWIADTNLQRRLGCSEGILANGGRRMILYMLCTSCFDRPTRTEDVETEILRRLGVQ